MARNRQRHAGLALAGAVVLALTGCAADGTEVGAPGPGLDSAAGAMASAEPANPASRAGSGSPASRGQTASSSGSGNPADPDTPVSSTDSANPGTRANHASPAGLPNCPHGSAFALSLASDQHGWATPIEAAQQFSRQSSPSGYGTPDTVWTAGAPDSSGVTLTATDLMLHAVRLRNGRWAIDSGQRCD